MSSIIVSVFKRKGGEGEFTKVVTSNSDYSVINAHLHTDEKGLIIDYRNDLDFTLLTNKRIIAVRQNGVTIVSYAHLEKVVFPMVAEYNEWVKNKFDYTKIQLIDADNKEYIIAVEKGKPWQGFYQTLHFITRNPNFAKA